MSEDQKPSSQTTQIHDAIEAGTEAASDLVSAMPPGERVWGVKEYVIAARAAKAAAEHILRSMGISR